MWTERDAAELQANVARGKGVKKRRRVERMPTEPLRGHDGEHFIRLLLPPMYTRNHEPRNVYARNAIRQHWKGLAALAWQKAGRRTWPRVEIEVAFHVPDKHKRDRDNYLGTDAMKAILDGLIGKCYPDDNSECVRITWAGFEHHPLNPCTLITIRPDTSARKREEAKR